MGSQEVPPDPRRLGRDRRAGRPRCLRPRPMGHRRAVRGGLCLRCGYPAHPDARVGVLRHGPLDGLQPPRHPAPLPVRRRGRRLLGPPPGRPEPRPRPRHGVGGRGMGPGGGLRRVGVRVLGLLLSLRPAPQGAGCADRSYGRGRVQSGRLVISGLFIAPGDSRGATASASLASQGL